MPRSAFLACAAVGVAALVSVSCGGGGSTDEGGGPPPPVASVQVSPSLDTLHAFGATHQFTATARDAQGQVISGKTFTWVSTIPSVATVSAGSGLVTAVAEGSTSINASVDGVTGVSTLVVKFPAPVGGTIQGTITPTNTATLRRPTGLRRPAAGSPDRPSVTVGAKLPFPTARTERTPRREPRRGRPAAVPGEWVVTFRSDALGTPAAGSFLLRSTSALARASGAMRAALRPMETARRASIKGISGAILAARVQVAPGVDPEAVRAELRRNPAVAAVEPNYLAHAMGQPHARLLGVTPNDPLYPLQAWHYTMIGLPRAWQLTTGQTSVTVAVVDDGIRNDHIGVLGNLTNGGYDFVSDLTTIYYYCGSSAWLNPAGDTDGYDPDPYTPVKVQIDPNFDCAIPEPSGGHGTHVAGTIGAPGNDGIGVTGVAWTVRIRPIRVLGVTGTGNFYDIAQGILYAAGLPADDGQGGHVTAPSRAPIINMSLGGQGSNLALQNAVQAAYSAGSLLIASAGNDNSAVPNYPASYPEVVSVSAVGPDQQLASYSSYGTEVDITAPGGDLADGDASFGIMSTAFDFQANQPIYDNTAWNGTSMAAPHVSGVAALLLAASPGLTAAQLRLRLESYAIDIGVPGVDAQYGHGLVNAYNALTQSFGPPTSIKVFLYNAATGAVVQTVTAAPNGAYQFTGLAPGTYRVYAGQDESADGLFGRPLRRWSAFGGAATPTDIAVTGSGTTVANFPIGVPVEVENNNSLVNADELPVGGYLYGTFTTQLLDFDIARVLIPAAGQYTFETAGPGGACGYGLEEDTILELLASNGTQLAVNDDININAYQRCSRITVNLNPGTYYLRTSAFSGQGANGINGQRYTVFARSGP